MTVLTQHAPAAAATSRRSGNPAVENALDLIHDAIAGLTDLADMVATRPQIASSIATTLRQTPRVHVYIPDRSGERLTVPERIAELAAAAAAHGASLSRHHDDNYGGVIARFGYLEMYIYSHLNTVGAVATRTHSVQITDWQPGPALTRRTAAR